MPVGPTVIFTCVSELSLWAFLCYHRLVDMPCWDTCTSKASVRGLPAPPQESESWRAVASIKVIVVHYRYKASRVCWCQPCAEPSQFLYFLSLWSCLNSGSSLFPKYFGMRRVTNSSNLSTRPVTHTTDSTKSQERSYDWRRRLARGVSGGIGCSERFDLCSGKEPSRRR